MHNPWRRRELRNVLLTLLTLALILIFVYAEWWQLQQPITPAPRAQFAIKIQSDTSWAGAIVVDGITQQVNGSGPQDYSMSGVNLMVGIQKNTPQGYLYVTVFVNDKEVAMRRTTATYGGVMVKVSSTQTTTATA
jgi:hypothetical protein